MSLAGSLARPEFALEAAAVSILVSRGSCHSSSAAAVHSEAFDPAAADVANCSEHHNYSAAVAGTVVVGVVEEGGVVMVEAVDISPAANVGSVYSVRMALVALAGVPVLVTLDLGKKRLLKDPVSSAAIRRGVEVRAAELAERAGLAHCAAASTEPGAPLQRQLVAQLESRIWWIYPSTFPTAPGTGGISCHLH